MLRFQARLVGDGADDIARRGRVVVADLDAEGAHRQDSLARLSFFFFGASSAWTGAACTAAVSGDAAGPAGLRGAAAGACAACVGAGAWAAGAAARGAGARAGAGAWACADAGAPSPSGRRRSIWPATFSVPRCWITSVGKSLGISSTL